MGQNKAVIVWAVCGVTLRDILSPLHNLEARDMSTYPVQIRFRQQLKEYQRGHITHVSRIVNDVLKFSCSCFVTV